MTHHPLLRCWCWAPFDAIAHFSYLIQTDPLIASSLFFAAVSPALKSEETQEKGAIEQHSNNDKVDTLPVIPKHTCLNIYGPLNEYL